MKFDKETQTVWYEESEVLDKIRKWADEEFFGGELGDKDSDEFESNIGGMKSAIRELNRKFMTGKGFTNSMKRSQLTGVKK